MIKTLLSPPRRGLPSLHDSSPPVRARRSAAAHSSRCLGGAGGRRAGRALPLKPRYLTFVFGRGNKRGSSRLSARTRGRLMKAVNVQTWSLRWSDLITQSRELIRRIRDLITASDSNQWTQTNPGNLQGSGLTGSSATPRRSPAEPPFICNVRGVGERAPPAVRAVGD